MLLPMNACELPRHSATSIWSSEAPARCVRAAMRNSVSPSLTRYSSPDAAAGGAGLGRGRYCRRARCRCCRAGRSRRLLWRGSRCGRRCGRRCRCNDRRDGRGRGSRCSSRRRRIEQHRVLAHQAATGPGQLQDHVDEGLLHDTVADHTQVWASVGAVGQGDHGARQHGAVVHASSAVRLGRRHSYAQRRCFLCRDAGDVDFGTQVFAQRRLHRKAAQAECPAARRGNSQHGNGDRTQREAGTVYGVSRRLVVQGVSQ